MQIPPYLGSDVQTLNCNWSILSESFSVGPSTAASTANDTRGSHEANSNNEIASTRPTSTLTNGVTTHYDLLKDIPIDPDLEVWSRHECVVSTPQGDDTRYYLLTISKCELTLAEEGRLAQLFGSIGLGCQTVQCAARTAERSEAKDYQLQFHYGADSSPFFECVLCPPNWGSGGPSEGVQFAERLEGKVVYSSRKWWKRKPKAEITMVDMCRTALLGLRAWIAQNNTKYSRNSGTLRPVWLDLPKEVRDELDKALIHVYPAAEFGEDRRV